MEYCCTLNIESWMYIVGWGNTCFVFSKEGFTDIRRISVDELEEQLKDHIEFIRINIYTIINTRFYMNSDKNRNIVMKNGIRFKVSRRNSKLFKLG